jgi:hypothetical protein
MYVRGLGQALATSNCGASSYTDPVTGNTYDACGHLLVASPPPTPPMQAGTVSAVAPVTTPASPCSFALFNDQSCIGPIGMTTLLVLGAVAAFFLMMKGGR